MQTQPPISANNAVKAVMEFIERGIRDGAFVDAKLPTEAELAAIVGVSRTPVREAIKILGAVGVVEIRRGIGTFVRPQAASALGHLMMFQAVTQSASVEELFEARLMVERTAAEMVAETRTDADIALLREVNEAFRAVAQEAEPDLDKVTDADTEFHKTMFRLCRNPLIAAMGALVLEEIKPRIRESHALDNRPLLSVGLHDLLIEAIDRKDPSGAGQLAIAQAVRYGLENWRHRLELP